ncbi:MAG: hypothetical protein RR527_04185 [Clostridia bacterium]
MMLLSLLIFKNKPNKKHITKLYSIAMLPLISAASFLFASGCHHVSAPYSVSTLPTATPSVTSAYVTPTPSPKSKALSKNPVYEFYSEYDTDVETRYSSLICALTSANTIQSLDALIQLSEHDEQLNKARVTAGLLIGCSFEGLPDSICGPIPGSGTIENQNGKCQFDFFYDDGAMLAGTLDGETLSFTMTDAQSNPLFSALLCRRGNVWLSCVSKLTSRSILCFDDGSRFAILATPIATSSTTTDIFDASQSLTWDSLMAGYSDTLVFNDKAYTDPVDEP